MAARLGQPAERAFDIYIASLEARLARQHAGTDTYLAALAREGTPRMEAERELLAGAVRVEPVNGGSWQVRGGLVHHWRAGALVPRADARDMLALLRDYDHLARYYSPEVVSSRALAHDGEKATHVMRFRKHQVITIVLDAEFETRSALDGAGRGYSVSRSTHIWQIDRPGSSHERRRPEGEDDGFLWRLNSYWSFEETRDGLLIQCEAASLTRDVPAGLGWLISPIVQALPRSSLEFTLTATKGALEARAMGRHEDERPK
jgi:hypothetical protein